MNVLSLFDGMSCGQIALNRAGIPYKNYFASEIKKSAIKVTQHNYPNTIQLGDVTKVSAEDLPQIDLLIGGSPCQDFSIARTVNGNTREGLNGDKSKLFFEWWRVYNEVKPTYFLLENVVMEEEDQNFISNLLGVAPRRINSKLVSFQQRDRLYWTNIPYNKDPEDKGLSFQDFKDMNSDYLSKFKVNKTPSREVMWGNGKFGKCPNVTYKTKINCLTIKQDRWNNAGLVEFEDFCRYLTTRELELAQTVPVGYTSPVSFRQAEDLLGDGWTVDVIAHIFKGIDSLSANLYNVSSIIDKGEQNEETSAICT